MPGADPLESFVGPLLLFAVVVSVLLSVIVLIPFLTVVFLSLFPADVPLLFLVVGDGAETFHGVWAQIYCLEPLV